MGRSLTPGAGADAEARAGLPSAVLWDFDGTLVDSETMWVEIETQLARDLGGELPADYHEHTLGGTIAHTASYIVDQVGSDEHPEVVADELWARAKREAATGPIRWRPGARELLEALASVGVPQALVSSGHRHYLEVTLARLSTSPFAAVVAGDEVDNNKPHPEPYLRAADALGVPPDGCLVIEDSPTGAASGLAAGCGVLAVPEGKEPAPARRLVVRGSLAGLDLAGLAEFWATLSP